MRKTSKIILVTIIATLILLGLGYAAITNITLNIAGSASATADSGNFKVRFTDNISVSESAYVTATRTGEQTATIAVSGLTSAGQEVTATYEIKNESSDLSADLKVDTSNNNTDYFKISSKLAKPSLTANETTTVLVTVELIKTPIDADVSANIGVELTAMPVQPGEEGTSSGMNDYSETPTVLNDYGFHYDTAYVYESSLGTVYAGILHEDKSVEMYRNGAMEMYLPAGEAIYEMKKIVANGTTVTVSDDGTQLTMGNASYILDESYMDKFNNLKKNEYGFYYGQPYSLYNLSEGDYIAFIFNEDESVYLYKNDETMGKALADVVEYNDNTIQITIEDIIINDAGTEETITDYMTFTVVGDGKVMECNGNYIGLDPTYFEKWSLAKLGELNEYGFYYGYAYSYDWDGLIITEMFNEDNTSEEYVAGILTSYTTDGVVYEDNKIIWDSITFDVEENGTQLVLSDTVSYNLNIDFMREYDYYLGKKNEYGFYFDEPYSFMDFSDNTEPITTYIVHEDGSMDYYYNHELVRNYPAGTLIYSENTIDATSVDMGIFDIKNNGRIAKSSIGRVVGLDRNFWERIEIMNAE